jgi:Asp-tRNA(Asn)/Glu-tRNA(Gln) amidotransferase A subunit family amidase
MTAPNRLSAAAAIADLAAGKLTAEALVRACLDRAAERQEVKAWTWLDPQQAIEEARAADRAGRPGLLAGLPIGVKDIIDTADMPTEHGSPIYRGNRPVADAACVTLLRKAGGIVIGKTVTTEFANRFPGATVHPHNPRHTPGGSSSGSAAAVADCQVPAALGTQTGGSVIRPAAFCGVVGYKPTFGQFALAGVKLQCHTLDTLGILCRSLDDLPPLRAALVAGVEAGPGAGPGAGPEPGPGRAIDRRVAAPRIGLCRSPVWERAEPATQALIENTAARLAAAGAAVSEVSFAPEFATIHEQHRRISSFEAARNYAWEYDRRNELVSQMLRDSLLTPGRQLPLSAYVEAIATAEGFRRHLDDIFGRVDALLTPSAPGEAPEGLASTGEAVFNSIWTLAWTPCVTLPAGTGPKGLPLGVQLVGPRFRDEALFDAAAWVAARL